MIFVPEKVSFVVNFAVERLNADIFIKVADCRIDNLAKMSTLPPVPLRASRSSHLNSSNLFRHRHPNVNSFAKTLLQYLCLVYTERFRFRTEDQESKNCS